MYDMKKKKTKKNLFIVQRVLYCLLYTTSMQDKQ